MTRNNENDENDEFEKNFEETKNISIKSTKQISKSFQFTKNNDDDDIFFYKERKRYRD